ncbi:hypothetical protein HW532_04615 [Kaustia mangrovi]|uniref:Capsule polysaccharide biosynthesis protein n=1 Tax=Kaustia mangrovi TaxID=2593653 RepID=A0A7S8C2E3_9HYPH|nr:hypothetical protein [Kaustia mangrovi]QPC42052.1 hypothetical protein HW532_04615 [Kaustia mangrovi]
MLEAAFDEAEGGQVVVKCHPETVAGTKVGHIAGLARRWGALIVDGKVNPWDLIERAHTVYTVSSQLGFEALMAARPVRCFGMPFYAGWGSRATRGGARAGRARPPRGHRSPRRPISPIAAIWIPSARRRRRRRRRPTS